MKPKPPIDRYGFDLLAHADESAASSTAGMFPDASLPAGNLEPAGGVDLHSEGRGGDSVQNRIPSPGVAAAADLSLTEEERLLALWRRPTAGMDDLRDAVAPYKSRIAALEAALAEAVEIMKPFGTEGNGWAATTMDSLIPYIGEVCTREGFEGMGDYGCEASFTVGDLRRAAAFVDKCKKGTG